MKEQPPRFEPRAGQAEVLAYTGGRLGISAVPGSGKTRTLAELAAKLVDEALAANQEVLVVTLVNAAVNNLKRQISEAVRHRELLAGFGYRVRTLHGLAHDIIRDRPGLVGLAEDFGIIDERAAAAVLTSTVEAWIQAHPDAVAEYLALDVEGYSAERVKRQAWPRLAREVASAFVRRAKDLQLGPEVLLTRLEAAEGRRGPDAGALSWSLARMGVEIYADYQRSLAYRGAVDFDDLTRYALEALQCDDDYLERLRHRWPYILEDEAQDSSLLQERLLRLLAGEEGNWVRVGDPNQAIFETFTTANPRFLLDFLDEPGVTSVTLGQSGRSQPAIVELANRLVDWSDQAQDRVRPLLVQHIESTGPGDPQPNPPADLAAVNLSDREFPPDQELVAVADSLERWLPEHQDWTVAVLDPRNERGVQLTNLLQRRGIPFLELLGSTSHTRRTAGALGNLLHCLADPKSAKRLAQAFEVWRHRTRGDPAGAERTALLAGAIRRCRAVESYLWPRAGDDWLLAQAAELAGEDLELLRGFRETARHWHRAASLPIDQLVLTLAGDIFEAADKLALAHKLALLLRDVAQAHPSHRLPELVQELAVIARNERRFLGFSSEETGFVAPRGKVTVTTMHKAKGLEWDRVYLMSVNTYDFPGGSGDEAYIAEKWFIRDRLNLGAEALAQLAALAEWKDGPAGPLPAEGWATRQARLDYAAERLRLFYVGITRAQRDLIVTWNTGRRAGDKLQPTAPLAALQAGWPDGGEDAWEEGETGAA